MNYDKINMYIPVLIQWYSLHQESVVRGRPEFPTQLVYNKEHEKRYQRMGSCELIIILMIK